MAPRVNSAAAAVVVVALLALAAGAAAQMAPAAAPVPSADCGSALTGLAGCLTYITPGTPMSKPPADCCAGVKAALASPASVACLCGAIGQNFGIPINMTRAAGLPAACGGNPAAFSKCNLKLPGGAPASAPSPSSTGSTTPTTSSPSPSKSAATATRSPVSAMAVLAAVAAPLLSYYYL